MNNLQEAKLVLNSVYKKIKDNSGFSGIEITTVKKNGISTAKLCVRVLVRSKSISHSDLSIPKEINNIPIIIEYRIIDPF